MQRKYAKPPAAIYKDSEKRRLSGLSSLLWLCVGIAIVVIVAVFLYWSPLFDGFRQAQTADKAADATASEASTDKPKIEYEFYDILPKQEFQSIPEGVGVQVAPGTTFDDASPDAVVNAAQANNTDSKVKYILQIRSYPQANDADLKRAEVLMAGVDAVVVRRKAKDGTFNYQVISTPMSSREAARANARLKSNGIDSLIIEQRH